MAANVREAYKQSAGRSDYPPEIALDVLKRMGLVPQSARFNRDGEIVDANGRKIDWEASLGADRERVIREVEQRVADEVERKSGKPASSPKDKAKGADVLRVAEERAQQGRREMASREPGTAEVASTGGPGDARAAADAAIAAAGGGGGGVLSESGGFFGGGDEGAQIPFGGERARPDITPTPGSGAHHRMVEEGGGGVGRVPSEAYAGLTSQQQEMLPLIFSSAERAGVDSAVLFALLYKESKLNPGVSSPQNKNGTRDHGIAQLNEATLRDMGKSIAWAKDPKNAIEYAANRLASSIRKYGSVDAALIEYNGGQGMADKFMETGRYPYSAAKDYIKGILDVAGAFNPNGIYESDMPDEEDMFPGFTVALTNPADIKARADQIGAEVLGRNPTKKQKKLIVAAIQASQKASGMGQATAQWVAETGGDAASAEAFAAYGNGKIPKSALAPVGGGHFMRPDAAAAFLQMKRDAAAEGVNITLTDSYRDYDAQVDVAQRKGLYSQGGLAAKPGTSNHGWGTAVDVDEGQEWLARNGKRYGFDTIDREPWHWEYKGGGEHGQAPASTEGAMTTYTEGPSMDALIAAELERMNPEEAGAKDVADAGMMLLEIIGGGV